MKKVGRNNKNNRREIFGDARDVCFHCVNGIPNTVRTQNGRYGKRIRRTLKDKFVPIAMCIKGIDILILFCFHFMLLF